MTRQEHRSIPNEIFFAQVKESLAEGENVRILVTGCSMRPTFRHKVDQIVLSRPDKDSLAVGDVVLFDRGDTLCVHRIIARDGRRLVIRGDGNSRKALEKATLDDVIAIVVGGTMFGGREFTTEDAMWKRHTERILRYFPLLALWHRVTGILKRYPLSILVLCLLFYLSFFKPASAVMPDISNIDKLVHATMYFGTSLVFWFEWLRSHRFCKRTIVKGMIFCTLFPICLGGLIELGQSYITEYRSGEWWDFYSDAIGSILATIIALTVTYPIAKSSNYGKKIK